MVSIRIAALNVRHVEDHAKRNVIGEYALELLLGCDNAIFISQRIVRGERIEKDEPAARCCHFQGRIAADARNTGRG